MIPLHVLSYNYVENLHMTCSALNLLSTKLGANDIVLLYISFQVT